jgi:copper chaperone CopZ
VRRASVAILALLCLVCGCTSRPDSATVRNGDPARPERSSGEPTAEGSGVSRYPSAPRIVTLEVGGMTCQSCVARVSETLAEVSGVRKVQVSLDQQSARVWVDPEIADTALTAAVRRAGPEFLGIVRR